MVVEHMRMEAGDGEEAETRREEMRREESRRWGDEETRREEMRRCRDEETRRRGASCVRARGRALCACMRVNARARVYV
jgi:hypothetical protein